ncbi:MAG TPA: anti-sigma factor [Bryobacteraceae bacterium]|nr:anti-sigma factor [Bryobacteraceae bacterium]
MNCDELRESYGMYARGAAGEPQRGEIRVHLDRGCEACTAGIKRAVEMAAARPQAPRRIGWAPFWAAAAVLSLAAALYFSGRERQSAEDARRFERRLRAQTVELVRFREAFTVLDSPGAMVASFGETQQVSGRVFANRAGVLLLAANLSAPPAGMAWQMWVIPKGARPAPAGMFRPDAGGAAVHVSRQPCAPGDMVEVTLENEAGANAPTSAPVIAAVMPASTP